MRMHADEVAIDLPLVRRLIPHQFPENRDLPVRPIDSPGTVDAVYRSGGRLCVRLPRKLAFAAQSLRTIDEVLAA